MAVSDDIREAIASLKKITDTIDKIDAVKRDITLMLSTTKFTDTLVRISLDRVVDGLSNASSTLITVMNNSIKEISRAQGGP